MQFFCYQHSCLFSYFKSEFSFTLLNLNFFVTFPQQAKIKKFKEKINFKTVVLYNLLISYTWN